MLMGILEGVGLRAGPFEYVRVVWARWRALVLLAAVWPFACAR